MLEPADVALGYAAGSGVSALFCITILVLWGLFPRLREHPSELLLYRACSDLVVAASDITSWQTRATVGCEGMCNCRLLGFINLFAISASEAWFLMLSVDLLLAIRNPFSFYREYTPYYHTGAWGYALAVSGLSLVLGKFGLSLNRLCYLRDDPRDLSAYALFFSFVPQLVMLTFAVAVMVIAFRAFSEGLPNTVATRRRVLSHCRNYVSIIGLYWFALTLVWLLHYGYAHHHHIRGTRFIIVYTIIRSLRGGVDLLAFLTNSPISLAEVLDAAQRLLSCGRHSGAAVAADLGAGPLGIPLLELGAADGPAAPGAGGRAADPEKRDNINQALRRDLILCTAWGILDSLREAPPASARVPSTTLSRKIYLPKPFLNKSFVVTNYDAEKFARLRAMRGINDTYGASFSIPADGEHTMLEKFTEGRSGSFFYFTFDYKYIVKTITDTERKLLQSILNSYTEYLEQFPASLLTRFCGLHAIQMSAEQKFISFVVMENVFAMAANLEIHETYDLKGSWVNRRSIKAGMDERAYRRTRKDDDLKRNVSVADRIEAALKSQMAFDVGFLNEHQIMDYSLLVGVHNCCASADVQGCCNARRAEEEELDKHHHPIYRLIAQGMRGAGPLYAPDTESVFFCGIIDMLQLYDWGKTLEHYMKTIVLRKDPEGISCVGPDLYANRFLTNLGKKIGKRDQ